MQIAPFNYVKKMKHYEASKWSLSNSNGISAQANLMIHVPRMREDHLKFSSELARYSNEVTTTYKETPRCDFLYNIVLPPQSYALF